MIIRGTRPVIIAMDRKPGEDHERLAFDRGTVRRKDEDGRLHVAISNISKATVNPYRGAEIPKWQQLGLEPDRVYQLLRDPAELEKGAATFNNIPVLSEHVPVTAENPRPDLVVGSTGTDATFSAPYLTNSLVFWDADAIGGVEGDEVRELSCAYRYDADMTPGTYEGQAYDGVMRNLRGNHVALVEAGRAGSDVVVGDSRPKGEEMKVPLSRKALLVSGAIRAYLGPKMAADSKIDVRPILSGVTSKNYPARISGIATKLKKSLVDGKLLAQDADIDDLVELLDGFKDEDVGEDEPAPKAGGNFEVDEENPRQPGMDDSAGMMEKVKAVLKEAGVSDDILAKLDAVMGGAQDAEEDEAAKKKREAEAAAAAAGKNPPARDAAAPPKDKEPKDMVSKGAMDAALKKNAEEVENRTIARLRSIGDAERLVSPIVGEIKVAMDSASDVFRFALEAKGVDVPEDASESALRAMVLMLPAPGSDRPARPLMAADAKATSDFTKRFPMAIRPRNLGA